MQALYFYISVKLVDDLIHYFYTDLFNIIYEIQKLELPHNDNKKLPPLINGTISIDNPVVDLAIIDKNDGLISFNGKSIKAFQKAELIDEIPCFSMKA